MRFKITLKLCSIFIQRNLGWVSSQAEFSPHFNKFRKEYCNVTMGVVYKSEIFKFLSLKTHSHILLVF